MKPQNLLAAYLGEDGQQAESGKGRSLVRFGVNERSIGVGEFFMRMVRRRGVGDLHRREVPGR